MLLGPSSSDMAVIRTSKMSTLWRAGSLQHRAFASCRPRYLLHCRRNVANQSTRVKAAESSHREASDSRDVPVSIEPPPGTEKQPSADLEAQEEVTFYEGSGAANAELVLSCLLGLTLVYAPLTIASIGRRLWIQYRFTNKRLIITNTSPLFKSQTQVAYSQVKEVRSVPRGFGAWGDMVIFLQGGGQLELLGMEKHAELKDHIERCKWTL